jgi:hypothetical protein
VEVAGGSIEGIGAKESRSSRGENSSRALQNQNLKKAAEKNNDSRPQNVLRIRFLKKKPCRTAPILEIRGGTCIEDPPIYEREVHSLGSHPSSGFGSKMIPVLLRDSPTLSLTPSPQIWDVVFIGLLQESIEEVCRMTGPVWGRSAFAARCAKWKGTCTSRSLSHAVAC